MGATGSKDSAGSGAAVGAVANRSIVRKQGANKEDLFTVATYSVLAESTLSDTAFPYWPKKDRKLKRRHPTLVAELRALHADVICLQNVESEYFQQSLLPDLAPLGYKGQFVAAPGGGAIGVATFWNTGTFKLLKSHVIGMNEVATKACKKHKVNPGSARLLNNSFAQTTLLQLLPAKHAKCHAVVVANAALMWDGQQPDVQTVEAALFVRELQSYAKHVHEFKESAGLKEVSIGYVVAGDLASTPKSAQYSLLRKGALDEKDVKRLQKSPAVRFCADVLFGKGLQANTKPLVDIFADVLSHKFELRSAYATVVGQEPPFTIYTDKTKACRDYVWYSSENLNANTALQLPDEMYLKPFTGLPNTSYPSDHLALVVGFRFKKTDAFTTGLPWDRVAADGEAAAAAEEEDEEAKAKNLDQLLGFSSPMDHTKYDRYGYEREKSGIAVGEDLTTEHWKPAKTRYDGTKH